MIALYFGLVFSYFEPSMQIRLSVELLVRTLCVLKNTVSLLYKQSSSATYWIFPYFGSIADVQLLLAKYVLPSAMISLTLEAMLDLK